MKNQDLNKKRERIVIFLVQCYQHFSIYVNRVCHRFLIDGGSASGNYVSHADISVDATAINQYKNKIKCEDIGDNLVYGGGHY